MNDYRNNRDDFCGNQQAVWWAPAVQGQTTAIGCSAVTCIVTFRSRGPYPWLRGANDAYWHRAGTPRQLHQDMSPFPLFLAQAGDMPSRLQTHGLLFVKQVSEYNF